MKQIKSQYNPLSSILELFDSSVPLCVSNQQLDRLIVLLETGGVRCDCLQDLVHCIDILAKLNILEVEANGTQHMKIGNKLNGKIAQ